MSKPDPRTANYDISTTIEGAESLISLRMQAATSFDNTEEEEDLEEVHAQRAGSRGRHKNQLIIGLTDL
jgi:hypothetical protein